VPSLSAVSGLKVFTPVGESVVTASRQLRVRELRDHAKSRAGLLVDARGLDESGVVTWSRRFGLAGYDCYLFFEDGEQPEVRTAFLREHTFRVAPLQGRGYVVPADVRRSMRVIESLPIRNHRASLAEVSPPGFSGTVRAMKRKHPEIDNPYALVWHMYNRGAKPHYAREKGKPAYVHPSRRRKP
jgi:hypothetical protein